MERWGVEQDSSVLMSVAELQRRWQGCGWLSTVSETSGRKERAGDKREAWLLEGLGFLIFLGQE